MPFGALVLVAAVTLRDVTVVNRMDTAIFSLRVGRSQENTWSDDLLGFANVIDVSRGVVVHVPIDSTTCTYDVQATLRGGAVVVIPSVDLCATDTLDVKPSST